MVLENHLTFKLKSAPLTDPNDLESEQYFAFGCKLIKNNRLLSIFLMENDAGRCLFVL
jgi:hypothetical protein